MRGITTTIRQGKTRFFMLTSSLVLGIGLLAMPAASALTIGGPSDCDDNAIVRCGVHSTSAVMNAYQSSAYVRGVFAYFGISNADINNLQATNVSGRVTKDGKVFIDGQSKAVATNAITGGRQDIPGSTQVNYQGAVFYRRPPSVSFQQQSLPAFVAMKNGQFQYAIIASCGNAVKAAAVSQGKVGLGQAQPVSKPPAKPAPKPAPAKPTQTQSQSQSQSQSVNVNNTNTTTVQNNTTQPQSTTSTSAEQPAAQQTAAQPSSLVNTGSGGVVGVFLAASAAGAYGFRRYLTHKFANSES